FDADDLEARVALEYAAEHQHCHDVLTATHDRKKGGEATAARSLIARGQNVKRDRQLEVDGRAPEVVVDGRIIVLDGGMAGHHHAAQTHFPDRLEIPDPLARRAHRRLADSEQPLAI